MRKKSSKHKPNLRPIVVGASIGGVEALTRFISRLPEDLPAPVLVVLHTSPEGPGLLPEILHRAGKLLSAHAEDGERIMPRRVYVAPPDCHLVVEPGQLRLTRGPKVNRTRPAVDILFESAAEAYGSNVIGILLTGSFVDGVAGLEKIKQHGGIAIVQDPKEAFCPEMPLNALRNVDIDYVLPVVEISSMVSSLVKEPSQKPLARLLERNQEVLPMKRKKKEEIMGLTCPECNGPIRELKDGAVTRYICRVGHAFTTESFMEANNDALERSLWAAVQMLEERAELLRRIAARVGATGRLDTTNLEDKASDCEKHAATIRQVFEKLPREH